MLIYFVKIYARLVLEKTSKMVETFVIALLLQLKTSHIH